MCDNNQPDIRPDVLHAAVRRTWCGMLKEASMGSFWTSEERDRFVQRKRMFAAFLEFLPRRCDASSLSDASSRAPLSQLTPAGLGS
jgi:hypothetical protein